MIAASVLAATVVSLFPIISSASSGNIVLTNDDGWADAQIRALYTDLTEAGYDVVLSAPAENMSGTGSLSVTPTILLIPCEYDTCPAGSPAEGYNASDPHLNYVNAFPVDAVAYGVQTLAPKFFDGAAPDFVVSGVNIGNNVGLETQLSGTVGAACEAATLGVPAGAFSGANGSEVSYTTLESDPIASSTESAWIYSALTVYFVDTILDAASSGSSLLPSDVIVNVNYPAIDDCSDPSDYQWVFARNLAVLSGEDMETCGSTTLPSESDVIATSGCYASVSAISTSLKTDVDATTQAEVYTVLEGLPFTCLPSSS